MRKLTKASTNPWLVLFIMFRPARGRPLIAASVWLLLLFEAAEVAEVVGALGDLCAAAALIIIRRVSSALLGWW